MKSRKAIALDMLIPLFFRKEKPDVPKETKIAKINLKNRKAIALDMLGWILLGVAVLVLVFFIYMIFSNKGEGALEFLKNIFRLRR